MATMHFSMILVAVLAPAAALAAPPPTPVQRLSDAEVERVLAEAAAKREAAEASEPPLKRPIQGEVGVAVGTGGYRAVHGTAFVPLGEESGAIVSFSSETRDDGYRRRR